MASIESKLSNQELVISLKGRIDSTNSEVVEKDITESVANNPHSSITLDAENLEYISSAGLRVILRLRKNEPTLKVINAKTDVYDVFEMTGFTEMIPVSKAYRNLSVEGCEVIGQGANGKVYRLDRDTIIKVYLNPDSLDDIHRERELARKAFVLGIPTAIPYDVVKVNNSYGSVFELLSAKSFAKLVVEDEANIDSYIDKYVELLKKIHSTEVKKEDMPDQREVGLVWAEFAKDHLPKEVYDKLIKLFSDIPTVHHILHGDYHVKNVMLQNGETLLIDMDTLCQGHPIYEFAGMYNAYKGFGDHNHDNIESFLGIKYEIADKIFNDTIKKYLGTDDENKIQDLKDKAKLVGYTRLLRRMYTKCVGQSDFDVRVKLYKDGIIELVNKLDTLTF